METRATAQALVHLMETPVGREAYDWLATYHVPMMAAANSEDVHPLDVPSFEQAAAFVSAPSLSPEAHATLQSLMRHLGLDRAAYAKRNMTSVLRAQGALLAAHAAVASLEADTHFVQTALAALEAVPSTSDTRAALKWLTTEFRAAVHEAGGQMPHLPLHAALCAHPNAPPTMWAAASALLEALGYVRESDSEHARVALEVLSSQRAPLHPLAGLVLRSDLEASHAPAMALDLFASSVQAQTVAPVVATSPLTLDDLLTRKIECILLDDDSDSDSDSDGAQSRATERATEREIASLQEMIANLIALIGTQRDTERKAMEVVAAESQRDAAIVHEVEQLRLAQRDMEVQVTTVTREMAQLREALEAALAQAENYKKNYEALLAEHPPGSPPANAPAAPKGTGDRIPLPPPPPPPPPAPGALAATKQQATKSMETTARATDALRADMEKLKRGDEAIATTAAANAATMPFSPDDLKQQFLALKRVRASVKKLPPASSSSTADALKRAIMTRRPSIDGSNKDGGDGDDDDWTDEGGKGAFNVVILRRALLASMFHGRHVEHDPRLHVEPVRFTWRVSAANVGTHRTIDLGHLGTIDIALTSAHNWVLPHGEVGGHTRGRPVAYFRVTSSARGGGMTEEHTIGVAPGLVNTTTLVHMGRALTITASLGGSAVADAWHQTIAFVVHTAHGGTPQK